VIVVVCDFVNIPLMVLLTTDLELEAYMNNPVNMIDPITPNMNKPITIGGFSSFPDQDNLQGSS
jgi:hypothetical protein